MFVDRAAINELKRRTRHGKLVYTPRQRLREMVVERAAQLGFAVVYDEDGDPHTVPVEDDTESSFE